jgi:hypothetical protein
MELPNEFKLANAIHDRYQSIPQDDKTLYIREFQRDTRLNLENIYSTNAEQTAYLNQLQSQGPINNLDIYHLLPNIDRFFNLNTSTANMNIVNSDILSAITPLYNLFVNRPFNYKKQYQNFDTLLWLICIHLQTSQNNPEPIYNRFLNSLKNNSSSIFTEIDRRNNIGVENYNTFLEEHAFKNNILLKIAYYEKRPTKTFYQILMYYQNAILIFRSNILKINDIVNTNQQVVLIDGQNIAIGLKDNITKINKVFNLSLQDTTTIIQHCQYILKRLSETNPDKIFILAHHVNNQIAPNNVASFNKLTDSAGNIVNNAYMLNSGCDSCETDDYLLILIRNYIMRKRIANYNEVLLLTKDNYKWYVTKEQRDVLVYTTPIIEPLDNSIQIDNTLHNRSSEFDKFFSYSIWVNFTDNALYNSLITKYNNDVQYFITESSRDLKNIFNYFFNVSNLNNLSFQPSIKQPTAPPAPPINLITLPNNQLHDTINTYIRGYYDVISNLKKQIEILDSFKIPLVHDPNIVFRTGSTIPNVIPRKFRPTHQNIKIIPSIDNTIINININLSTLIIEPYNYTINYEDNGNTITIITLLDIIFNYLFPPPPPQHSVPRIGTGVKKKPYSGSHRGHVSHRGPHHSHRGPHHSHRVSHRGGSKTSNKKIKKTKLNNKGKHKGKHNAKTFTPLKI